MTIETVITLEPISAVAINESSGDDWLNNNDAELINASAQHDSVETSINGERYNVDTIACKTTSQGVFLQTENGEVELFSGDQIIIAQQAFRVKVTQENTQSAVEPKLAPTQTLNFVGDDIWGSGDERRTPLSHVPDPFQQQTHTVLPAVAQPLQGMPDVHSNDTLNFLYQSNAQGNVDPNALLPSVPLTGANTTPLQNMPNYFSGNHEISTGMAPPSGAHLPGREANVLNELGIGASATSNIIPQEELKSVLDESPLDRLDEYLSVDEERYQPPAQSIVPQTTARDENSPWLQNVRSLFTPGKKL